MYICIYVYMYACTHTCIHTYRFTSDSAVTGWRRCIGCLKLQISFRKRASIYGALLRKMTYKDKVSYDATPPCTVFTPAGT